MRHWALLNNAGDCSAGELGILEKGMVRIVDSKSGLCILAPSDPNGNERIVTSHFTKTDEHDPGQITQSRGNLRERLDVSNSSPAGCRDLASMTKAIKSLETGTVNINHVPGYRMEEGVIEAMTFIPTVKTFSIPR